MKKTTIKILLTAIFICPIYFSSYSQELRIQRVEFKENKVVVHYDLADSVAGRSFVLRVYSSLDNYLNPLTMVSGDVGHEVKSGLSKKLVWDAKTELGITSNNKVSIELRAHIFIPFIKFGNIDDYKHLSRGRPYNITWSGGSPQNILIIDLYRGDRKVATFPNIANVGHYKIKLPLNIKPGDGYRFRISDHINDDDVVYTGEFGVRRKIPLSIKIASIALIGGVGFYLLSQEPDDNSLPLPLKP